MNIHFQKLGLDPEKLSKIAFNTRVFVNADDIQLRCDEELKPEDVKKIIKKSKILNDTSSDIRIIGEGVTGIVNMSSDKIINVAIKAPIRKYIRNNIYEAHLTRALYELTKTKGKRPMCLEVLEEIFILKNNEIVFHCFITRNQKCWNSIIDKRDENTKLLNYAYFL